MRPVFDWSLADRSIHLGERTLIMGVLNVTPDSFYDGGRHLDAVRAVSAAVEMATAGADIIDIGGESTRPHSEAVDPAVEAARVLPVIEGLRRALPHPRPAVSIDTRRAEVARQALTAGAEIINDVSAGGHDPDMLPLAARARAGLILMHMRGTPADMHLHADYRDLLGEIATELEAACARAVAAGVSPQAIMLDPGIGFAKRPEHNLSLVGQLGRLAALGRPILSGPSRKSFIGHALKAQGLPDAPDHRLPGTLAAVAISALMGAHVVRVHDVAAARQALAVADAVRQGRFIAAQGDTNNG